MAKNSPSDDPQHRNGKAIAEQPYSVDPARTPEVGRGAAGPKRRQKQPGQALDDPPDSGTNDQPTE